MNKNSNDWLYLGLFLLVVGFLLAVYSVSTYTEIKSLSEKVDFELIDDNNSLSSSEKYYKYLSIGEFLTQKIDKNKTLPIKNSSCIYLDYAQHNAIELYTLTDTRLETDEYKQKQSIDNIKGLRILLDSYNTCPKSKLYKDELDKLLTDAEIKKEQTTSYPQHNIETYKYSQIETPTEENDIEYQDPETANPDNY